MELVNYNYACMQTSIAVHYTDSYIIRSFLLCRKFDKFTAELHPMDQVWHTIGVDLIGPLPETEKGNKYIMTVSPEATALKDKTVAGVAEFLYQCFTRHGCCQVRITDQGKEFFNQVHLIKRVRVQLID